MDPSKRAPEDLKSARERTSFPVEQLSELYYGKKFLEIRRKVLPLLANDPIFSKEDFIYLGRTEKMQRALQKVKRYVEVTKEHQLSEDERFFFRTILDETLPNYLHENMFVDCLRTQGSPEQVSYWMPLAESYKVTGCYAQTELAHGSNLSCLETRATYIPETDEFELHSPTLTSTKWWIGSLGLFANHAFVIAKLFINGKDYGPHPFVAQIRSFENHTPLDGVLVGDIGPKMGYQSIDNGWIRFNRYRIPRNNMMMRFAKVTSTGEYIKPAHNKLAYTGMVQVRTMLAPYASLMLAKAITIAIRYCTVRRQFSPEGAEVCIKNEVPVINYQMVQYKLFPILAQVYGMRYAGIFVYQLFGKMMKQLMEPGVNTSLLSLVHGLSSALKTYCTDTTSTGIELARRSCGGHGFMQASAFPHIFTEFVPSTTFEGENSLLTQQTARFLLKQLQLAQKGKLDLSEETNGFYKDYFMEMQSNITNCGVNSKEEWFCQKRQLKVMGHRVCRILKDSAERLMRGVPFTELNMECADLSKAYSQYIVSYSFWKGVEEAKLKYPSVYEPIKLLCHLYNFMVFREHKGEFMEDGYVTGTQGRFLEDNIKSLLKQILPHAVGLVDAFDFSDYELNSTLGKFDGDVYTALMSSALKEPLNGNAGGKGVVAGYEEYIRPIVYGLDSKL